jgi:virulence factor Mce-like protein
MRRRGAGSIASNPVLIGAATTLVVIVAVFLAYNANNGLPFVPTYQLQVNVPSAANLVKGNEVRIGGTRVGTVDKITPERGPNGQYYAQLEMKLQTSVRPLPKDSAVLIRPRSALGLKYVEITTGHAKQGFADGSVVPLANARPLPVEIDQVLNTFDDKTRRASQINLFEFGNALTGRGQDVNTAIENLNPLLTNLIPVMKNLADPRTRLARLFQALERASSITAPAAQTQADLFRDLDITFNALAGVAPQIKESIRLGPNSLDTPIRDLPFQRVFLLNNQRFFHELRPGVRALRTAAPALADAVTVGTTTLIRSEAFNRRLKPLFASLERFAADPLVTLGLRDVRKLVTTVANPIHRLVPAQTVCNYLGLWFRNVASLLSEGDKNGTWQRFIIVSAPSGSNNEGGPSSAPADGPSTDNHLHTDPYPTVNNTTCEAANEVYAPGKTLIGHAPSNNGTLHDPTKRDLTK